MNICPIELIFGALNQENFSLSIFSNSFWSQNATISLLQMLDYVSVVFHLRIAPYIRIAPPIRYLSGIGGAILN